MHSWPSAVARVIGSSGSTLNAMSLSPLWAGCVCDCVGCVSASGPPEFTKKTWLNSTFSWTETNPDLTQTRRDWVKWSRPHRDPLRTRCKPYLFVPMLGPTTRYLLFYPIMLQLHCDSGDMEGHTIRGSPRKLWAAYVDHWQRSVVVGGQLEMAGHQRGRIVGKDGWAGFAYHWERVDVAEVNRGRPWHGLHYSETEKWKQ